MRRVAAKILLAPVSVFPPRFLGPYGAGLATFVKAALALPGDVGREPFGMCHGWLGSHLDCWASTGYLRVGIRTPDGVMVDVYTTHLGHRDEIWRSRHLMVEPTSSLTDLY